MFDTLVMVFVLKVCLICGSRFQIIVMLQSHATMKVLKCQPVVMFAALLRSSFLNLGQESQGGGIQKTTEIGLSVIKWKDGNEKHIRHRKVLTFVDNRSEDVQDIHFYF